mgnify:CR=1 FL=1
MDIKQYQKNILLELMNLDEFKKTDSSNGINQKSDLKDTLKNTHENSTNSLKELEEILKQSFGLSARLIEGGINSKILFFFGKCDTKDKKILDGESGDLFDKMLSSIKLDRNKITLASYIPRGLEHLSEDENFLNRIQLANYRLIELINPKYLIIMSNFCIKMLLGTDLSSMSLRGKWFDFNTPNDTSPKKCRVLYEPEILLNNTELKKDAWEDLKEIKKQLGG